MSSAYAVKALDLKDPNGILEVQLYGDGFYVYNSSPLKQDLTKGSVTLFL